MDRSACALTRQAVSATAHCLTGCAIGEVLGMVIGTALGWSDLATIALAVALAFLFGYALTVGPVLRAGVALSAAVPVALAADTLSITVYGDRGQRDHAGDPRRNGRGRHQRGVLGQPRGRPRRRVRADRAGEPLSDRARQGPRCGAPVPPTTPGTGVADQEWGRGASARRVTGPGRERDLRTQQLITSVGGRRPGTNHESPGREARWALIAVVVRPATWNVAERTTTAITAGHATACLLRHSAAAVDLRASCCVPPDHRPLR